MNIFAPFPDDPPKCAQVLDNKRLNKMILETGQILSTAMHILGGELIPPYKPFNPKHPCCIWAAESRENFVWLVVYLNHLIAERKFRFPANPPHSTQFIKYIFELYAYMGKFKSEESTSHPNCTRDKKLGIDFTHVPDTGLAYTLYLTQKWLRSKTRPTWGLRKAPGFFEESKKSLGMRY